MKDITERLRMFKTGCDRKECERMIFTPLVCEEAANEIERLRDVLYTLSYIHDSNPSDEWAMVSELAYARHMLFEVRQLAREALPSKESTK